MINLQHMFWTERSAPSTQGASWRNLTKVSVWANPRYRAASWIADANRRQELSICFDSQCWAVWRRFHNGPDDLFGENLVEDEPLVDVMALDAVLFDDLEHEFLAEHVAYQASCFG